MNQYIITEELAKDIGIAIQMGCDGTLPNKGEIMDAIYSHPYQSERFPTSKELLEMANTEWKNREERKGIHDRISWTSGWISGYLTPRHCTHGACEECEHLAKSFVAARKQERDTVLKKAIEIIWELHLNQNRDNPFGNAMALEDERCINVLERLRQAGE